MCALLLLHVYFIYIYISFVGLCSPHELQHLNITTAFLSDIFLCTWGHFPARLSVLPNCLSCKFDPLEDKPCVHMLFLDLS